MYRELLKFRALFLFITLISLLGCDDIFETDITDEMVIIQSPADSMVSEGGSIGFLWQELEGANQYQIQIVEGSFSNIQLFVVDSIQESTYFEGIFDPGSYQWRVKAFNNGFETAYSTIQNFSVADSLKSLDPAELDLIAPTNGKKLQAGIIDFRWTEVEGASHYIFKIPGDSEYTDTVGIAFIAKEISLEEGSYNWMIVAQNEDSEIESSERSFIIDNTVPLIPRIVLPQEGDTITTTDSIQWQRRSTDILQDRLLIYEDSLNKQLVEGFPQNTTKTYYALSSDQLLQADDFYYYRVLSIDSAENYSDTTASVKFFVSN